MTDNNRVHTEEAIFSRYLSPIISNIERNNVHEIGRFCQIMRNYRLKRTDIQCFLRTLMNALNLSILSNRIIIHLNSSLTNYVFTYIALNHSNTMINLFENFIIENHNDIDVLEIFEDMRNETLKFRMN